MKTLMLKLSNFTA